MSSLTTQPKIPFELDERPKENIFSSDAFVYETEFREFTPTTSSNTFTYDTVSMIDIDIHSDSQFLDGRNSYIAFDLVTDLEYNASSTLTRSLAVGGAIACFNSLKVSGNAGGVTISEMSRFNKLYAVLTNAMSKHYIEDVAHMWGDSLNDATLVPHGSVMSSAPVIETSTNSARRASALNRVRLVLPLAVIPFFAQLQYLPMPFIRNGIRVTLGLEDPSFVLRDRTSDTTTNDLTDPSYTISNVRLYGRMVRPSDKIRRDHERVVLTSGLKIPYIDYGHSLDTIDGTFVGSVRIPINRAFRSCRAVHTVLQNEKSETIRFVGSDAKALQTLSYDSIGNFLKMHCTSFSYDSGSKRFPYNVPLELGSVTSGTSSHKEAFVAFRHALRLLADSEQGSRASEYQWEPRVARDSLELLDLDSGGVDSTKLVLSADLSRYQNDPLCGLDIRRDGLGINLVFDTAYTYGLSAGPITSKRYVHSWIEHDKILEISEKFGTTVKL